MDHARAARKRSEVDFERTEKLVNSGTIGSVELQKAQSDLDQMTEATRAAELALARTARELATAQAMLETGDKGRTTPPVAEYILAPMEGTVLHLPEEFSRPVNAGVPLIEIGGQGPPEVVVDLPTPEAVPIHPGVHVAIGQWGGPEILPGVVRMREGSAFTKVSPLGVEEQRINLIIDPAPGPGASGWDVLENGYYVEARITLSERPNVLKVSLGALFRKDSGWAAYAIHDNKTVLRRVEVGEMTGADVEVLSGVTEGEKLVRYPGDQIREAMRVTTE